MAMPEAVTTMSLSQPNPDVYLGFPPLNFLQMRSLMDPKVYPNYSGSASDAQVLSTPERRLPSPYQFVDPVEAYCGEIEAKGSEIPKTVSAYDDRIEILKKQAEADSYSLNPDSLTTFMAFFKKILFLKQGRLVLLENGNLRAVWKSDRGDHIGLQFLDKCVIQYVIFRNRDSSLPISRVTGRDTIDGVIRQIVAFDLKDLLYA